MLAIVGGKGGCGKTTTALGTARALAATEYSPVVVDVDCGMPNLHTMAETPARPGVGALADGAPRRTVAHRSRGPSSVDVVPAGDADGQITRGALDRLRRWERQVLLDCPAGASDAVAAPLRTADDAVVVTTPTAESLEDAAKTARLATTLEARLVGAVLTRSTDRTADRARARRRLPSECPILGVVPEVGAGGDGVFRDRVGRAAYERLAQRLYERNI